MMLNVNIFVHRSFPCIRRHTVYLSLAESLNVLQNGLIYSFKKILVCIEYVTYALLYNYYGVIYHEIYASEVYYSKIVILVQINILGHRAASIRLKDKKD